MADIDIQQDAHVPEAIEVNEARNHVLQALRALSEAHNMQARWVNTETVMNAIDALVEARLRYTFAYHMEYTHTLRPR
ncbi:hypothetical protein EVB27_077 [Rhizobium phage RHph_TM16]|nr:hypothetical protein EVB27_077 [Rhizobium phage RHph_TM16]